MDKRWPARLALLIMTAVSLAVMSMWGGTLPFGISAFAQATPTPTRTPTPTATSTRACTFPPPPLPCPPGGGTTSPTPTGTASPTPTPTDGGGATARSKITIRFVESGPAFKGRVSSAVSRCVPNRRVALKRVVRGDPPDAVVGRDVTNRKGQWIVHLEKLRSGRYYAVVSKSVVVTNQGEVTCKSARSETIRVRR